MVRDDSSASWGCVIGRFQPFHRDHFSLAEAVLDSGQQLIVAITNAEPAWRIPVDEAPHRHTDLANPFTYGQRAELVRVALEPLGLLGRVRITPFPIHEPSLWSSYLPEGTECWVRARGPWESRKMRELATQFPVRSVPAVPCEVSGTSIRRRMREGDWSWTLDVPAEVARLIEAWSADGSLVMSDRDQRDVGQGAR